MTKQEAIDYLAKILKPDLLGLIVRALASDPQEGDKLSYHEAVEVRHLCPACGEQGVLFDRYDLPDRDYERYQCPELHIFYVSKAIDGDEEAHS